MTTKQKFTRLQGFIIGFLGLILVFLLAGMGIIIWPDVSSYIFPPTPPPTMTLISNIDDAQAAASPTEQFTPTERFTPTGWPTPTTRILKPTWTQIYTPTSIASLAGYLTMTITPTMGHTSTSVKTLPSLTPVSTNTRVQPTSTAVSQPTSTRVPPTNTPTPTKTPTKTP